MTDINKVKEFFLQDRFVKLCGIEIVSADKGICECRMKILDHHLNAGNVVQGGVLFTIADFTFAVAANCDGKFTVSLNNNITYIKPPKGEYLIARANKISSTRSTCLYEVKVYDDLGTLVAFMNANGYIKNKEMNF